MDVDTLNKWSIEMYKKSRYLSYQVNKYSAQIRVKINVCVECLHTPLLCELFIQKIPSYTSYKSLIIKCVILS